MSVGSGLLGVMRAQHALASQVTSGAASKKNSFRFEAMKIPLICSRDSLQTCPERRLQRQTSLWRRRLICGADLFHDALDEEIEDLQLAVKSLDELLIWLNASDQLRKRVVPPDDTDPAALRDVELTLQLRSEALIDLTGKPVYDLGVRQGALISNRPPSPTSRSGLQPIV
jgi:hypothetical protein